MPLLGLAVLPLIVPFIVLGVSLFLLFSFIDVPRSLLTIAAGHSVIALPFATLILLARMSGMDPALEDAAMDLGATYLDHPAEGRAAADRARRSYPPGSPASSSRSTRWRSRSSWPAGDPTFPVFLYGQLRFAQRLPGPDRDGGDADGRHDHADPDRVPPGSAAAMTDEPQVVDAWRGPTASQAAGHDARRGASGDRRGRGGGRRPCRWRCRRRWSTPVTSSSHSRGWTVPTSSACGWRRTRPTRHSSTGCRRATWHRWSSPAPSSTVTTRWRRGG